MIPPGALQLIDGPTKRVQVIGARDIESMGYGLFLTPGKSFGQLTVPLSQYKIRYCHSIKAP